MARLPALVLAFTALPIAGAEPDWPQFRGPKRDGISPDQNLLKAWPSDGPPLAWKAEGVGVGYSSVAVAGDQVLTMGDAKGSSYVFAVSRMDGTSLWQAPVGRAGDGGGYPGSRSTPTVDGDRVYALGPAGEFACLGLADGKEHWKVDLVRDFQGSSGGWQYAESPLVDGDKVIVTPGGRTATMLALDKVTGKPVWKGVTPDGEAAGYSSTIVSRAGGVKQYVTLTSNSVVSFAADTGKLLWRYGASGSRFADNTANIPTVVAMDEPNTFFAAAGYGRGGGLFRVQSAVGKLQVNEVYWRTELQNKHGGVIRVGNHFYGDHDDSGRIWCADVRNGKVLWTRKNGSEGGGSASLTYADGMLYVRYQNGWVALVSADPKGYKFVSTFRVPNGTGNCWAHPVVIGGKFYVREQDVIWCYDVAAKRK
jgi:outer membrane protein assembly factor BamB